MSALRIKTVRIQIQGFPCVLFIGLAFMVFLSGHASADDVHKKDPQFKYVFSSGVFPIHRKAHSVDWSLINKSNRYQAYRVTIYEADGNERKSIVPGSLTGSLAPSGSIHNANSTGKDKPFDKEKRYEVVVEINSTTVKPKVEMWSGSHESTVISETVRSAKKFRLLKN